MAPPKACWPQRILSADFLGINWNKVSWMTPYSNFYPITITGGHGNRLWTNFVSFGHFSNRAGLITARNLVLLVPSIYMTICVVFMLDWYQFMLIHYLPLGIPMPEWAEAKHKEELIHKSWHKPGAMFKHHLGGPVSIPGTGEFVSD
eukprot:Tbor_TRINITY_DN3102_c0_g1::TRINITY_DN3102_c0_g1_i1::g.14777::m.14777